MSKTDGGINKMRDTDGSTYWYEYQHDYCPVCGWSDDYKVRVYDRPKPDTYQERHHYEEVYNYCEG
jgi:ribosomal protein L37E